jgi:hypothetical protein
MKRGGAKPRLGIGVVCGGEEFGAPFIGLGVRRRALHGIQVSGWWVLLHGLQCGGS